MLSSLEVFMAAVQLEFNLKDESYEDLKISAMQQQIDAMHASMGKVRKKLFGELSELKKACFSLQIENQSLKEVVRSIKGEKTEWVYLENGFLCNAKEAPLVQH